MALPSVLTCVRQSHFNLSKHMFRNIKTIRSYILSLAGLALVLPLQGLSQSDPGKQNNPVAFQATADFWNSPEFVKTFMGNYGFRSEVEPKFNNLEEQKYYTEILELLRENPEGAIESLKKQIKPESSSILSFTLAKLQQQEGEVEAAKQNLEVALAKSPDFLRAHRELGFLLAQNSEFEAAAEHLVRTIELDGADGPGFGILGYCYLNLDRPISAEGAYRNAMLLAPSTKDWKLGLIKSLYVQSKFNEGSLILDELIQADPENEAYWSLKAEMQVLQEKLLDAVVSLETMRRLGKAGSQDLGRLADLHLIQNRPDLAVEIYEAAMKGEEPLETSKLVRAGEALTSQGYPLKAAKLIEGLESNLGESMDDEMLVSVLKLKSKIALSQDNGDTAIQFLEQALEKDPLDGEALILVGDYYQTQEEWEKAVFRYETASRIDGYEADALVKQAQVLVKQGKYTNAISLLEQAQKIRPKDFVARYLESVEKAAGRR